jgi:hypothetical protein
MLVHDWLPENPWHVLQAPEVQVWLPRHVESGPEQLWESVFAPAPGALSITPSRSSSQLLQISGPRQIPSPPAPQFALPGLPHCVVQLIVGPARPRHTGAPLMHWYWPLMAPHAGREQNANPPHAVHAPF